MGRSAAALTALVLAAVLAPAFARAETRYVTDVLLVNLREAPQPTAPTIRLLPTGEALQVLESRPGFLRVRTGRGEEGWVAEQYAATEVPAAVVAARLQEEISGLRTRLRTLEEDRDRAIAELDAARKAQASSAAELQQEITAVRGEAQQAAGELRDVRQQYERLLQASRNVAEVTEERDRLRAQTIELRESVGRLEAEKSAFVRSWAVRWFLAGAGVLTLGWMLGALTRKKKSRFST
jgi:SH3 domain protein